MNSKSYSDKATTEASSEPNWSEVADNAAKKAELKLNKIKQDAKDSIKSNSESYNNPTENK
ncbi:hypothetical protein [Sporosarcina sp. FA9]|uniref:hypothetical protein n=1 Tax=Sporosarcina sp. FA9 TaxID=3413030 RepID=UPI003F65F70A